MRKRLSNREGQLSVSSSDILYVHHFPEGSREDVMTERALSHHLSVCYTVQLPHHYQLELDWCCQH